MKVSGVEDIGSSKGKIQDQEENGDREIRVTTKTTITRELLTFQESKGI